MLYWLDKIVGGGKKRSTFERTWAARPPAPPLSPSSSCSDTRAAGRCVSGGCSWPDTSRALTSARRQRRTTGSITGERQQSLPVLGSPGPPGPERTRREFHRAFSHVLGCPHHAPNSPCCVGRPEDQQEVTSALRIVELLLKTFVIVAPCWWRREAPSTNFILQAYFIVYFRSHSLSLNNDCQKVLCLIVFFRHRNIVKSLKALENVKNCITHCPLCLQSTDWIIIKTLLHSLTIINERLQT